MISQQISVVVTLAATVKAQLQSGFTVRDGSRI